MLINFGYYDKYDFKILKKLRQSYKKIDKYSFSLLLI